jgi:hypothetical protein
MRPSPVRRRWILVGLLALSTACRDTTGPEERGFQRARDMWRSQALANYDYTLRRECFCPMEYTQAMRVQVRADLDRVVTIDQIFEDIERTLDHGKVLSASYDAVYGFPVEARLDRITNAIDDEGTFFLSDFQVKSAPGQ